MATAALSHVCSWLFSPKMECRADSPYIYIIVTQFFGPSRKACHGVANKRLATFIIN